MEKVIVFASFLFSFTFFSGCVTDSSDDLEHLRGTLESPSARLDRISAEEKKVSIKGTKVDGIAFQFGGGGGIVLESDVEDAAELLRLSERSPELIYPAVEGDSYKKQALEVLINQRLIQLTCERYGLEVSQDDISKQIERIIESTPSLEGKDDLVAALKVEGKTLESFEEDIRNQFLYMKFVQRLVTPYLKVTRADLEAFFLLKTGESAGSTKVSVRKFGLSCIDSGSEGKGKCSAVKAQADLAYKDFKSGLSLEKVAKNYPEASVKLEIEEYDLSVLASDELREKLENAEKGGFTEPTLLGSSFFIFEVVSKEKSLAPGFDEGALRKEFMLQLRSDAIKEQLSKLRVRFQAEAAG